MMVSRRSIFGFLGAIPFIGTAIFEEEERRRVRQLSAAALLEVLNERVFKPGEVVPLSWDSKRSQWIVT